MNWTKTAEVLGVVRDAVVILVGFVYACGYVVWSLFALHHALGPRSALDAQYFVAGAIPALSIGASVWLYGFVRRLPIVAKASVWHVIVMWLAVGALIYFMVWEIQRLPTDTAVGLVSFFLPVIAVALSTAVAVMFAALDPHDTRTISWTLAGGAAVAVLLVLETYASVLYEKIPMEVGGGKPRCVIVEVDSAKIGPQTLDNLHAIQNQHDRPRWQQQLMEERPHAVEVYLWAMTDNWTLLGEEQEGPSRKRVEIRTDAISAMLNCGPRYPPDSLH